MRISICHCLNCQKRSGSAFAAQARWPFESVAVTGRFSVSVHEGESGSRARFRFCPECGSTVAYDSDGMSGLTAIAIGAFADPKFPAPHYSVYEERQQTWVSIVGDGVEHFD